MLKINLSINNISNIYLTEESISQIKIQIYKFGLELFRGSSFYLFIYCLNWNSFMNGHIYINVVVNCRIYMDVLCTREKQTK